MTTNSQSVKLHCQSPLGLPLCGTGGRNPKYAPEPGETTCDRCRSNHAFPGERLVLAIKGRRGESRWIPGWLLDEFDVWFDEQLSKTRKDKC